MDYLLMHNDVSKEFVYELDQIIDSPFISEAVAQKPTYHNFGGSLTQMQDQVVRRFNLKSRLPTNVCHDI